jgi:predicted KAP-like P-loop ATPase
LPILTRELEISADEGFSRNDIFGRKELGQQLTRIVQRLGSPSVLVLDAPWGSGKTTFVKMWRGELGKAGIPSIYFDAFANDYQEDAFLAVASQIIAEAEALMPRSEKALKAFKAKALSALRVLGGAVFRAAVHTASAGLVEGASLQAAVTETAKAIGDKAADAVDDVLSGWRATNQIEKYLMALGPLSPNWR